MASTLLLDQVLWDLVLDAQGNIAAASEPYSLAQDAASAIRTFLGECWWDTTVGVDYSNVLGFATNLKLLKARLEDAALTVPDVTSAEAIITGLTARVVTGIVKVKSATTGQTSQAPFSALSPQGVG